MAGPGAGFALSLMDSCCCAPHAVRVCWAWTYASTPSVPDPCCVLLCPACSARLLGLDVCIDTVCGNDLMKGISGGQKKRVTTGEMIVGRLPCLFMDEISTGLDSSSTFLISKAFSNLAHFLNVSR